jgi:hypothetical protein
MLRGRSLRLHRYYRTRYCDDVAAVEVVGGGRGDGDSVDLGAVGATWRGTEKPIPVGWTMSCAS